MKQWYALCVLLYILMVDVLQIGFKGAVRQQSIMRYLHMNTLPE